MKYFSTYVSMAEVPNEINLCIAISGCPRGCEGCFWDGKDQDGSILDSNELGRLLDANPHVTNVVLLGGDWYSFIHTLGPLVYTIQSKNKKATIYSGDSIEKINEYKTIFPDYVKLGPYIKKQGGLNNPNTNQKLFQYDREIQDYVDITNIFHRGE